MSASVDIETTTPKQAAKLLERNENNRYCSRKRINRLVRAIQRGEWQVNGESIKVAADCSLLDGQHRLEACVSAKAPIETVIVRGLPSEVFKTIDSGKTRTPSDFLHVAGYKYAQPLATAARMFHSYQRGWCGDRCRFRPITNDQMQALLEQHPDLYDAAKTFMSRPIYTKLIPSSIGVFCLFLAIHCDRSGAMSFFTDIGTGDYKSKEPCHPPRVLVDRLEQTSLEVIKPATMTKLAWLITAWNAHLAGGKLKRLPRIIETMPRFRPKPELTPAPRAET